jgi:hypothetical protein
VRGALRQRQPRRQIGQRQRPAGIGEQREQAQAALGRRAGRAPLGGLGGSGGRGVAGAAHAGKPLKVERLVPKK